MIAFSAIRARVSARDAAEVYGLRFGRNGRAVCPWHEDHNPDLRFYDDGRCYCFACHAGGDAVALTAQIFGLSMGEAARKVCDDFHLDGNTLNAQKPQEKPPKRPDGRAAWGFLCDVVHEADTRLEDFSRESAWENPDFRKILEARTDADTELNQLWEEGKRHGGA